MTNTKTFVLQIFFDQFVLQIRKGFNQYAYYSPFIFEIQFQIFKKFSHAMKPLLKDKQCLWRFTLLGYPSVKSSHS